MHFQNKSRLWLRQFFPRIAGELGLLVVGQLIAISASFTRKWFISKLWANSSVIAPELLTQVSKREINERLSASLAALISSEQGDTSCIFSISPKSLIHSIDRCIRSHRGRNGKRSRITAIRKLRAGPIGVAVDFTQIMVDPAGKHTATEHVHQFYGEIVWV